MGERADPALTHGLVSEERHGREDRQGNEHREIRLHPQIMSGVVRRGVPGIGHDIYLPNVRG